MSAETKASLIAFGMSMLLFGGIGLAFVLARLAFSGRAREAACRLIAEALPHRLAYWVGIRIMSHASRTNFLDVPARQIGAHEALENWRHEECRRPEPRRRPVVAGPDPSGEPDPIAPTSPLTLP
ncbi:hypothetical protein [Singulisphaera sp. PoT]|uniref:hypothetical protein n=1 Tax=Singulisphaera sp. PoT TaxID=3411797 RepID=UPI003BF48801